MPNPTMTTGRDLVRAALRDNPDWPTLTIARMLYREHPEVWSSLVAARQCVRRHRGEEKRVHGRVGMRTAAQREAARTCGTGRLPPPRDDRYQEFTLPKIGNWLVCADLHVPYHDVAAIDAMLAWVSAQRIRIAGVLYLGDILDCYALSKFLRDPREVDFDQELRSLEWVMDYVAEALRPEQTWWKIGNHEDRLHSYLYQHAPELFPALAKRGLLDWQHLVDLSGHNATVIDYGNPVRLDELWMLHGHETGRAMSNPVNPARGAYLRTQACTLVAHQHRTSEHAETNIGGVVTTCWSLGCLCGLHPQYAKFNKWNHGFAIVHTGGMWSVDNKRIWRGKVL